MTLGPNPRVLIDHDDSKVVGRVRQLLRHPDTPWGLWLAALCDIDVPPLWLKRGTACSFGFAPLNRQEYAGWQIVRRGLVNEISLLSPSVQPAEPLAQVLTFSSREVPPKANPGEVATS
jgi:hypothetical protein